MQKWLGTGRLVRDPDIHGTETKVAKFTLAVNRRFKRDGEPDADFIPVTCFGKTAEFVEKYFTKSMKAEVVGEIRTGSYTNKDGVKIYTTEVFAENVDFGESKQGAAQESKPANNDGGFMSIPDGTDELPFS